MSKKRRMLLLALSLALAILVMQHDASFLREVADVFLVVLKVILTITAFLA